MEELLRVTTGAVRESQGIYSRSFGLGEPAYPGPSLPRSLVLLSAPWHCPALLAASRGRPFAMYGFMRGQPRVRLLVARWRQGEVILCPEGERRADQTKRAQSIH